MSDNRIGILVLTFVTTLFSVNVTYAQSFHTAAARNPDAGTVFIFPERIQLQSGGMFMAERGLMFVPLNRTKQKSDVIAVEFYRFPRSEKANPETPPIFVLNGGPGFPGLSENLAKPGFFEQQIQPYLNFSDAVVVGQRGIGSSKPDTLIKQPAAKPTDEESIREFQDALAAERDVWLDQGVDLAGFNVLECAADVRDVARALSNHPGYKKITIMGGSFGSHWGMAIMRRYPELIERAVLFGMEGPDHTWDHPGWYWNVYKRVAAEAEAAPSLKKHIPEDGLIAAVSNLVEQADREPFTVTLEEGRYEGHEVVIDGDAMRRLASGYSGSLSKWPSDVIAMTRGDFERAGRSVYIRSRNPDRTSSSTASYWMLDSGSGITARRRAEFESDPAMKIIGSTFWFYAMGSPVWQTDLGDEFRQNFETEIPTVIVHGTWDTSTPYENALELKPYFKNSKFITVLRGSHGALGEASRIERGFRENLMKFVTKGDWSGLPDEVELPEPKWTVPAGDE